MTGQNCCVSSSNLPATHSGEALDCAICDSRFHLMRNRYVCKACLRIVCSRCSPFRKAVDLTTGIVKEDGDVVFRVCRECKDRGHGKRPILTTKAAKKAQSKMKHNNSPGSSSEFGPNRGLTSCSTMDPESTHNSTRSGRQTPVGMPLSDLCDLVDQFEVPQVRLSKRVLAKRLLQSDAAPWVGMLSPLIMVVGTLLGYATFSLCFLALVCLAPTCFVCMWEYHLQEVETRAKQLARSALEEAVTRDNPGVVQRSSDLQRVVQKVQRSADEGSSTRKRRSHEKSKKSSRPRSSDRAVDPKIKETDPTNLDDGELLKALRYRLDRDHVMLARKFWIETEKRQLQDECTDIKKAIDVALERCKRVDAMNKEVNDPGPEWKQVCDKDGVKAWYAHPTPEHYAVRLEGTVNAPLAYVLTLLFEADLYHKWVPYYTVFGHQSTRKIYSPPQNAKQFLAISRYKLMWPFADREAVLACEGIDAMDDDKPMVYVLMHAPTDGYPGTKIPPAEKGIVRAKIFPSGFTIAPITETKSKLCVLFQGDPEMHAPDKLVNFIIKNFAPMMIKRIDSALDIVKTDKDYHECMSSDHPFYNWFRRRVKEAWPNQPFPAKGASFKPSPRKK